MASKRSTDASSTADASPFGAWPDHPLFPVDEGEKPPNIAFIHVTRKDRGIMVYGPMIRADELTSLDTIFERYGGGLYELVGRLPSVRDPSQPGNYSKRKWYMLPGRSKPLSQDPTADELRQAEAAGMSAVAPAPAVVAPSAAPGETMLLALLNMQQQQAQANAEASRQFMALMMTMITDSKKESVAQMQQMSTMMMQFSQSQQQSMISLMTAMLQGRGGGPEEMAKYADLLRKLGVGGLKPEDASEPGVGQVIENIADIVTGVAQLRGVAPGPNGQPAVPPVPGSAAAVAVEGLIK